MLRNDKRISDLASWFSLNNVIDGITQMISKEFGIEFEMSGVEIDQNGEIHLSQLENVQEWLLSLPETSSKLLLIEMKSGSQIYLDLFQRP